MTSGRTAGRVLAVSLLTVAMTHVGYPVGVRLVAKGAARRQAPALPQALPTVTVVVPAHDEAEFICNKVEDTLAQDYPRDLLEVVVVDDGSTDDTAVLAEKCEGPVRVVRQEYRRGKGAALNRGVAEAEGDIVVFTDANGSLVPGSLRAVVAPFADPLVAVVSGNKCPIGHGAHGQGEATYWKLENGLRAAESVFGAVVGADGGIYAVRRSTYRAIPPDVYADDYWIPLNALRRGWRVAHAPEACALESVALSKSDDFERRTRIAAGIWQESVKNLALAHPRRGWVSVAFTFHRLLRTMVVPLLLPVVLLSAARARRYSSWASFLWWAQLLSWGAAGAGAVSSARSLALPYQFAVTNVAAARGGVRQLRGGQSALWRRTRRGPWQ